MAGPLNPKPSPALVRPLADTGALQAAIADGLQFWAIASGVVLTRGMRAELQVHLLAAIARAARRQDPPNVRTIPQPAERRWWDEL